MSVDPHTAGAGAPVAEKQCPNCDQVSETIADHCWCCDYDFVTGQMPGNEAAAPGSDLRVLDLPVLPGSTVPSPAVQTLQPTAAVSAVDDHSADKDGLPPTTKSGGLSGALHDATATELGEVQDDIFTTDTSGKPGSQIAAAAPAPAPSMGIEPSALSIPAYNIEHPNSPHIILFVDFEFRRSRAAVSVTPPEPREPQLIVLTEPVQQFGRAITACSLSFDMATDVVHGCFIKEDNRRDYSIVDLRSKNGIKVNGTYVQAGLPKPLRDGDVITLGLWTKMVYYGGSAATTNPRS